MRNKPTKYISKKTVGDKTYYRYLKRGEGKRERGEGVFAPLMERLNERERVMVEDGREVMKRLNDAGFEAHIVGGAARDMLLNRELKDVDVTTNASVEDVAKLFETRDLGRSTEFGISLILAPKHGTPIEVAQFRTEGEYKDGRHPDEVSRAKNFGEDAKRRDFTVNALAIDSDGRIIDPVGGIGDLEKRVIRAVGNPNDRFGEDKLRMLRAVRFATVLGFDIDAGTEQAIRDNAEGIKKIASERILQEMNKIVGSPNRELGVRKLKELGVLNHVIPEVVDMVGVDQPDKHHPEGDVFEHTMLGLRNYHGNLNGAWAYLLHDVGKPVVAERKEDGDNSFIDHENVGAEMVDSICRRLKMPNEQREEIVYCVKNHMRLHKIGEMKRGKALRFVTEPYFDTLMAVGHSDSAGRHMKEYGELVERVNELKDAARKIPSEKLVSGEDIMNMLGLKQGKEVGDVKRDIDEKILLGDIKNREDVVKYLEWRKQSMKKSQEMMEYLEKAQEVVGVNLFDAEPEDTLEKGKYHAAWQKGFEMQGDYVEALHHQLMKERCESELEKGVKYKGKHMGAGGKWVYQYDDSYGGSHAVEHDKGGEHKIGAKTKKEIQDKIDALSDELREEKRKPTDNYRESELRSKIEYLEDRMKVLEFHDEQLKREKRNKAARERNAGMRDALDSMGVKKVRGALGGTYYE